MNVYDFDNTLYDGESSFDFFFYCLRRRPALIRWLCKVVYYFARYKRNAVEKDALQAMLENALLDVCRILPDAESFVAPFWQTHAHKLRREFYDARRKDDDVVISASFGFFLRPVCKELGISTLIASEVDIENKCLMQLCFRENKPALFRARFPDAPIGDFYTDSPADAPFAALAGRAFLVKKDGAVVPFPQNSSNETDLL